MEKLTKEVILTLSKEELQETVETLQAKLELAEKEKQELKELAELGKKYYEHLKAEAVRLVRAVDGDNAPLLKLIDRADADTLKAVVDDYQERAKEKFRSSSVQQFQEPETFSKDWLEKADYQELLKLRTKLYEEVQK
jgi:lysyl-tRNA synthetase class I